MTDRHDHGDHDEHALRARLAAADPAASLPPADPDRVARLLEDTMAADPSATPARRRTPLTWLVAAAAAVVIVAGIAFVLTAGGGEDASVAGPETQPSATTDEAAPEGVSTLEAGAPDASRCLPPTAALLASQDLAVAGTVEEVGADRVLLRVDQAYAGQPDATLELRAQEEALESLLGAVGFEVGGRYLVSAVDGRVSWCGLSGEDTPRLRGLYDQAFPQ